MNTTWYIDSALILIGIGALLFSIFMASRIVNQLEKGTLKGRWIVLRILVGVFIIGYMGYWLSLSQDADNVSLIVSGIFFFGGIFVISVTWLMLQTTRDIKRIVNLESQSFTDPLIAIFNRRYFDQRLNEEIKRSQRYKFPLSLLMFDLDYFKQINDKYGHIIGDKVLIGIGKTLKQNIRESDILARYGGEELVLVLPYTVDNDAVVLAERLRCILEQTNYNTGRDETETLSCTVSIGVASLGEENCIPTDLIHKADVALYQAKKGGRNQVVLYKRGYEDNMNG
jgi:diguanylate cyclase (GGDEF)-like protein